MICSRCEINLVKYPFMTSLCQKCRIELGHEKDIGDEEMKTDKIKENDILEMNVPEKYVIFRKHPRTKVSIEDGEISLDMNKKVMTIKCKLEKKFSEVKSK